MLEPLAFKMVLTNGTAIFNCDAGLSDPLTW
jgi:hypothetical protein